MTKTLTILSCLLFWVASAHPQNSATRETNLQSLHIAEVSVATEANTLITERELPDMPRPKQAENYRNRDRWRGDYRTPFHLDEPDRSWGRAMRHPPVLAASALLVGLTTIQLIKTDRCIAENKPACNLVTGKNRAAAYALNIPLTTAVVYFAGRFKQKGNGTGFILLTFLTFAYEAPVAYTANSHVLICQPGRVPQCQ